MRTIIDLPNEQVIRMAALCERDGLSRTEVVRRAVAAYLVAHRVSERDETFGMWRGRNLDGLAYERNLRGEWT